VVNTDVMNRMWAHNNPFLWDVAVLEQAEPPVGQPAGLVDQAAEPQQHVNGGVDQQLLEGLGARMQHTKLPEFWPHARSGCGLCVRSAGLK
jgi:hypothetical protein